MLSCVIFVSLFLRAAQSQDSHPLQAVNSISESCDSLCSCEAKDGIFYINCEQRNISTISQIKVLSNVPFHLNLYKNDLVELRAEEMIVLKNALSLHVGGNSIQELEPGVFSALGSLKKLHINRNFLVTLKEDTFQGLGNLEFLQADTNFIRVIEPGAFNKLIRLKVLILNDNSIEFLPNNIFRFVPLTHLDLRGNKLQTLPYVGFLEHIGRIMELLLEDNDWVCDCDILHLKIWMENMRGQSAIGEVVCSTPHNFKGTILAKVKREILCPSHVDINLEEPSKSLDMVVTPSSKGAQIPKLTDAKDDAKQPTPSHVPGSPCVEHCSCHNYPVTGFLMHCQDRGIQKVSDIGVPPQSPTKLVMTGNMIQKLYRYDFVTHDGLELLNLANNRIDYIDNETFLSLSSLKKLHLNGNRIEKLHSTMFVGLHNLEYLYLEYNLIKDIAPGTFNPLPTLNLLSLNNNLLSSLPAQIFRNAPLTKLNLRKNLFMHLPVSNVLDQLDSLELIYLEDNPWDCSCDLFSLKQWVEKLRKDTVVGSILCHTPKKVMQADLRSLRHEVLCTGLGTHSLVPDGEESVTATLGPDGTGSGLLNSITDTVPLSVLILSLLVLVLMVIFCSAGLVVFMVHRRRRRAKRKVAGDHPRENSSSSPIHLHYSMYGQKTTHHTLTQRPGSATLYEERSHSPIVQICRNPTYCSQHKDRDTDLDFGVDQSSSKNHVCRSIMEKENTSPLTGNPSSKFKHMAGECPAEFVTLGDPNSLYRNILEREKELQQLGITEYLRKNMAHLQPAVERQVPGHQEELKLMETIMYSRPRKVMLEQTKNEYFELKANLHTEPDYLEIVEHQPAYN
ncbi:LOW QUALITY PROTEIN: SLIT and NTRK-like protein 6 [Phyllopteryx taeniolatus]|uniref:LOW QUALITY PROTEIN: SLIT and NTRK-like protein 6 n=1 Tax=Phyllopteryx taeniolatus TaxID=161469 RepID=UPI002AD31D56|nr:LOW QUALITY PROTEIN: SLIT and NTRK-like protein 6 [Phyllopteryx taeniolatus]